MTLFRKPTKQGSFHAAVPPWQTPWVFIFNFNFNGKNMSLVLDCLSEPFLLRAVGPCCFAIPVPRCHPTSTDGLQLQTQSLSVPSLVPQQSSHPSLVIWHRRSTLLAAGDQAGLAGVVPVVLCPQMCDTELCCALGTAHRWDLVTRRQSLVCRILVSSRKGFRAQLNSPLLFSP